MRIPSRPFSDSRVANRITQIFIGHSLREGLWNRLFGNPVDRLIRSAESMDVCVFPH